MHRCESFKVELKISETTLSEKGLHAEISVLESIGKTGGIGFRLTLQK